MRFVVFVRELAAFLALIALIAGACTLDTKALDRAFIEWRTP